MSPRGALRIGTRASELALWQARHVESLLRAQAGAPPVELVHIKTSGDVQSEVPLWRTEGRAFFTKEIDRALICGAVDIAVHSLKDLATRLEPGVALPALLPREDPREALVSRSGAQLATPPKGARHRRHRLGPRASPSAAPPRAQPPQLRR